MRIRNVRGARERVASHKKVIKTPELYKGRWRELFNNTHPIYIEIGMGKGQFIVTHAKNNRDINYIGFEKMTNVLFKALDKIDAQEELNNMYVVRLDAENLLDIFDVSEVDGLYLNFSDPWPKDRHAKKRLTSVKFLERYNSVLKPNSTITFKTDNQSLFDFSLEQMEAYGLHIESVTRDLHSSPAATNNIMTEYERKFTAKGMPIYRVIARTIGGQDG